MSEICSDWPFCYGYTKLFVNENLNTVNQSSQNQIAFVFYDYFAALIMQGKEIWPVIWIQKLFDGDKCKRMIIPSINRVFSSKLL